MSLHWGKEGRVGEHELSTKSVDTGRKRGCLKGILGRGRQCEIRLDRGDQRAFSSRDGQRVLIYYVWTVLDNPNKYANWKFRSKPKFASANRARDRNDEERQT